jgi:tetratricopeptide (TPR) repeat protein
MMATGKGHRDFPEPPSDLSTRPDRERFLELSAVIHKACQANPRDRYAGARALVADFERLDAGHSVKRHHALQRGWAWSWKAAFVLALSGLGVLLVKNQRDSRATITKLNASPFAKSGATNYAAWEAQQRGLFMARTYTSIGFSNAIQEFERAVAVDPNYVRGWVVLSSYVFLSGFYGYIPGGEAATRARTCAETALKLEPNEAGPLFMLAECNLALDYDFARAEPLFRKAIQMNPTFDVLRENFAARLWYYGHFQEAEEMLQRVIHEAGAGSAEGYTSAGYSGATLGQTYGAQGRYEEALAALDEAIRLEPYRPDAYFSRADLQWAIGRRAEAARDWLRFVQLNGFASLSQTDAAPLEKALSEGGPDEFLRRLIELLEQRRAQGHFVSAYDLARLDAHLGKKTRALDYLELAADEHRTYALSAKVHVAFKGLHDEPRYHAVLRRLKLEQ